MASGVLAWRAWGRILRVGLLLALLPAGRVWALSSTGGPTPITGLNINELLGADRFYDAGYTGTRTIQANIEGGHIWPNHVTLGHATVRITGTGALGETRDHATSVGQAMGGRSPEGEYPELYHRWGMAPGATLWSGAVGKAFGTGSFDLDNQSVATTYWPILQTGVNGQTADVFNSSWGYVDPAGTHRFSTAVDGLIKNNGMVGVASVGNDGIAAAVGGIAAGYNAISVAALGSAGSSPPYNSVSSFSSGGGNDVFDPVTQVTHVGVRAAVDIAAPGQNLTLAAYDTSTAVGYRTPLEGTSFAAPLVAGGASLLVDAGKHLYAGNYSAGEAVRAVDGRVIKAVLLNSADKISGWDNAQALVGGVIRTTQSLDLSSGAGRMNLSRAFDQYVHVSAGGKAGVTDVSGGAGAPTFEVSGVGWDFGRIELGEQNLYFIDEPLAGGSWFTATLAWFIDREPGSQMRFNGFGELRLANLDLHVFAFDNLADRNVITTVAESISLYNSVEHLHFELPSDGWYGLAVSYSSDLWNLAGLSGEQYGLAWQGTPVPEPAAAGLLLACLFAMFRHRR